MEERPSMHLIHPYSKLMVSAVWRQSSVMGYESWYYEIFIRDEKHKVLHQEDGGKDTGLCFLYMSNLYNEWIQKVVPPLTEDCSVNDNK
jgi:hypothetical protein